MKLLHRLLADNGVILLDIDEIEYSSLRSILYEIFGVSNRIGTIIWKNVTDNNPTRISMEHEYVAVYAKRIDTIPAEWKSADLPVKDHLIGTNEIKAIFPESKRPFNFPKPSDFIVFETDLKDYVLRIFAKGHWYFHKEIGPLETRAGLPKSLYTEEEKPNGFELRVINEVANLANVKFWHRNIERRGFALNGWINHYPAFIVLTERGTVILLQTKGDDRDNSDSEQKLKLGKAWETAAGRTYKYFMVFDQNPIEGAFKLEDFLSISKEL